jgi:hypothetical protein
VATWSNLNQQDSNKGDMIRRWIAKLFKLEVPPPAYDEPEHEYLGYTMTDKETGMTLSVLMVCGCGLPVVDAGTQDKHFWCEHCDRPCFETTPCDFCEAHKEFDAEAVREEAAKYYEDNDE